MGGGLEADLSQGAVPGLWSAPPLSARWALSRPVLQVVDVGRVPDGSGLRPAPARYRYRLVLSDGVYSQHATLARALIPLAKSDDLHRGSIVRLLSFVQDPDPDHVRTVFITQLEILQTECALIGSLKLYKPKPPRNSMVSSTSRSMRYGLRSDFNPGFGAIQIGPSCGSYPSSGDKLPVWKLVGQIKYENLGYSDKPDLITVKATFSCVTELLCHVACPLVDNGNQCNAMATGHVDGTWCCNVCRYWFLEPCKYGCSVHIQIQDHTGTASATMYEEAAEEILGCRAKDLYSMKYKEHNHAQLDDIILGAVGKQYVFQLNVERERFFSGVKCTVLKAEKVNPLAESRRLLGQIDTHLQGMMGPPIGHAVESVPSVASGLSYGTTSAHNITTNVGIVQSNLQLQQPSLNSHQNPRFAVPSMAGGSGAPENTYDQPAQSFYQQPPPGHICRTPVSKNDASRLLPVAQLNPYQERWTIKARVTSKTDLRHYNNANGARKLFSFDLVDGQGGEIRARCFNAQADQFFDLIEVDKVYLISRGSLIPALKKLNSLNHEYEITLDIKTSIEVCVEDDSNIPRQQYNFRQISEIENIEANALVDLIGIVTSVSPSATIIRKDGSEAQKRTLQLEDMSGRSVEITLWGEFDAEGHELQLLCNSGSNPILSLKGGRVSDSSGRSVVTISSTQLKVNPDFPLAERLKQWYITEGKNTACISLSCRKHVLKTIAQIKDENLGQSDKPDFITVKGAISHLSTDIFCYPACTMVVNGRQCLKKVINNGDGTWQCDKCNKSLLNCEYRYLLQCRIQDHTGVTYATAFQKAGIEIVGHTAHELYIIKEEDPEQFAEILQGVRWQQFLFMLKVKEETFNDEQRVKCSIMRAEKLDPARQNMLTSSMANLQLDTTSYSFSRLTSSNVGVTGFAQSNWMPAPPSASSGGFDFNGGFGFLGQSAVSGAQLCFKCNQPGHWSKDCLVSSRR